MKKCILGLAAFIMALVMAGNTQVMAAQTKQCTQANQIAEICYQGYNEGVYGPIVVTQGTLVNGRSSKNVYLITLSGTELVKNQSTGYWTDIKVGFNQDNAYLKNVVAVIKANVPYGSNLVLAGHSLGGMVAQQVAANSDIKRNYNVLNTVTFGSPVISAGSREGVVKRLGDTSDIVPYMSVTGAIVNQVAGLNRESGGYGWGVVAAHTESYTRSDVWGAYDVTGVKNGSATLTLNLDTQTYYKSPTS